MDEIIISNENAVMSADAFEQLAEYSTSVPTGVYEGKMWKSKHLLADKAEPLWLLRWYGYSNIGPGHVSNHHRQIVLTDGELPK